jgi:rhodanese-related sulfurtransferase
MSDSTAQSLDPEITPETFLHLRPAAPERADPDAPILLDVREPWEFQAASLPGSLLMPMGEVTSRAHTELDPDQHIVVLCHHGQRSLSVAMWLRAQGFDRAQSLAGGIDAWSRTIDPAVPRY